MIALLLADGFEEVEALAPLDYLRRGGADVRTVGVTGKTVTGAHGVPVIADMLAEDVDFSDITDVILPGGMPGTNHLDASPFTDAILRAVYEKGGRLCAICAAPMVLGKRGYLRGKRATCFPGFEKYLDGAIFTEAAAVTDGLVTTGRGMECAVPFAKELVKLLCH